MARGIWIHTDKQAMRGDNLCRRRKRALRWFHGSCHHANAYFGYSDKVKQVDTRCSKCGIRVRFNLMKKVGDDRGKPTQAIWIPRSKDTRSEIEMKVNALNNYSNGNEGGGHEGFITALELMKEKNARIMGGDSE